MHPTLVSFHIGRSLVVLHAYSTFMVLAWIAAVAVGTLVAWRRGISWWRALTVFAGGLVAALIGARLLDLIVNWGYYAGQPARIWAPHFTGFSLYGGLILALIASAVLTRAWRLPLWRLADSAVPAVAASIVLMRIGCFLNGCCFGKVTALPWGVTFPSGSPAWAEQASTGQTGILGFAGLVKPVQPTQLYELAAAIVCGALALWMMRRRFPAGVPFLVFAATFTLFRIANDFWRAQLPTFVLPGWFYPMFYVVLLLIVGTMMVLRVRATTPVVSGGASGRRPRLVSSPPVPTPAQPIVLGMETDRALTDQGDD
jgi:phosphatidylglycerol---prolipoprotein diacylglyceryl transferase